MSTLTYGFKKSALTTVVGTAVAAAAVAGLSVLPAHADTPSSIVAAVQAQITHTGADGQPAGPGPGGLGGAGYVGGSGQHNSLDGQAWCADFAGWAWAQGSAANLGQLTDGAASFYDYGINNGTLSSTPAAGDAVVFSYNASQDYAAHVEIVTSVSGGRITAIGGNENDEVEQDNFADALGTSTYNGTISGYIAPATVLNNSPSTLATGTLVKSPDSAQVKVIVSGAGIALAGSDVSTDGYDLSSIVSVTDASFNALPSVPPSGTVVMDKSGTDNNRYVIIDGAAVHISSADWTADGYNSRPTMGMPTSWLQAAEGRTIPTGTVVMDQAGGAARYIMISGSAVQISAADWTADGYNTRPTLGVPSTWLTTAATTPIPDGTVVMDQAGGAARYVIINGAALHISASDWTADGYSTRPTMGLPTSVLATDVAATVPNGTIVMDQAGGAARYVMVGGAAIAITDAEWTADGYNTRPTLGVPSTWLTTAAAALPANGTLIEAPGDPNIYLVTNGQKQLLTASQFGTGGYNTSTIVQVPAELITTLPTTG